MVVINAIGAIAARVAEAVGFIAVVIAVLIAAILAWNFGTLSPCGVLRERVRQQDSLAAVLPDSFLDLYLAGHYGALSPGRCLAVLLNNRSTLPVTTAQASRPQTVNSAPQPAPMSAQNLLQWATQVTLGAMSECKARRLGGMLPNYVASAQCSNQSMIAAFKEARYRYMDLIEYFAAKRLEIAGKIDRGELTEQQAALQNKELFTSIQASERQRDSAAR